MKRQLTLQTLRKLIREAISNSNPLKKGDMTPFGKVVSVIRDPSDVIVINIGGWHNKKLDYIIDKAIDHGTCYVGKDKLFIILNETIKHREVVAFLDWLYNLHNPIKTENYLDVVAITDKDVVVTLDDLNDDLNENKRNLKEEWSKIVNGITLNREEYELFLRIKYRPDEIVLSWCGYSSKREFEDSADDKYSKALLVLTNFEDLEKNLKINEINVTANVAGYNTPKAFTGKEGDEAGDKNSKAMEIMKKWGYATVDLSDPRWTIKFKQ